ncbi:MAG: Nif3-like dinuclear metal center hexameric protein [Oscillospiraceae bacterium]|jgi:dinuclear metal center YbgI/SA1388 family protein|nr:Nif3-like dinuclear metal center hexameric protein [Oscillospiraceae bacterium]MCI8719862.1 Nif3-like dinuclear metal center hexameric protein [Oscillospiraceae bacterium]
MPTVHDIESALYALAPKALAAEWDNVGLLAGSADREVRSVLVALDITEPVVEEAERMGADLIVSHHPVIFHPVKSITDRDPSGRLLIRLVRSGTGAVCMHTNLDAAQGGVNDALASALGLQDAAPAAEGGIARIGTLPEAMALPGFLARVKNALRPNGLRYVDGGRPIRKVAAGGGACGDFLWEAAALGCDAFVTADLKYNHFLDAGVLGLTVIDAGHFPTEDVVCPMVVRYLREKFPEVQVEKSAVHREVIQYAV